MSEGREQIPLLWSTGGETALAKGFCFNMEWGGGGGIPVSAEERSCLEGMYTARRSEK